MTYVLKDVNGNKVEIQAEVLRNMLNTLYDQSPFYNPGIQGFINWTGHPTLKE